MTDRIVLSGIELFAHGGVSAAEREVGQRYRISLEIEYDLAAAAETDDIADTIHYGMVHTLVVDVLRERPFRLLESAAGRIADRILQEFGCDRVVVRLEKL
ncbi:MAG: dihydroneopterin aldolase, partial [Chloroflexota bacterium]